MNWGAGGAAGMFKQRQGDPQWVLHQVVVLIAAAEGALNNLPAEDVATIEDRLRDHADELTQLSDAIVNRENVDDHHRRAVDALVDDLTADLR